MRILIDMDSTTVDFFGGLWAAYEEKTGVKRTTSDVRDYDFSKFPDGKNLVDCFLKPGFFADLMPLPGAVESVRNLVDAGHDVLIVTAPATPHSAAEKYHWCAKYLGFISPKNVIMCARKELIHGEVLIDDSPSTARAWASVHIFVHTITIAYPYNDVQSYDLRADGYQDPEKAWGSIVRYIGALAMEGA